MANSKNFNFFTPSLLEREGMSKGNLHPFYEIIKIKSLRVGIKGKRGRYFYNLCERRDGGKGIYRTQ